MGGAAEQVHVARQPILDLRDQVFGYELMYRAAAADSTCTHALDQATARVIADALVNIGFDALTDGRRAFVNLSADILLHDAGSVFDPGRVVLEILENVEVTSGVVDMCRSLHARGYAIALDDFVPGSAATALMPFAQFVKLDVLALSAVDLKTTAQQCLDLGLTVVAEKVETFEAFEETRAAGCTLFQGYHFCQPVNFSGRSLAASQVTQMRLLGELCRPRISMPAIEDLLKQDGALSYSVLRTVNSAGFGLRREVCSIREALLLLGLEQIRKWTSVWVLAGANRGPSELITMAVLRGRACELMGQALDRPDEGAALFLLGLCSLLDAILGRPMTKVTEDLPLDADIRAALLGEPNESRGVLDLVVLYEQGAFEAASTSAQALGLTEAEVRRAYADALRWARAIAQQDAPAAAGR
jgi:EAL and modified HD-GYP domain-containing signal transduction protein